MIGWRTDAMRLARALRDLHHFIHPGTSCPGPECQAAAAMAAHDQLVVQEKEKPR
jgi:hypothetical protein